MERSVVMVALLRGINVGGSGTLRMAELRRIVEGCGHEAVRTYVQSGNVVFRTGGGDAAEIARELRRAIADASDVDPEVHVRTRDELAAVVAANPFAGRGFEPTHLHVAFTDVDAGSALEGVDLAAHAPEEATAVGRELYLHLPGGIGRSRLAAHLARRGHGSGTTRNWRTVTTLLAMADGTT